MDGGEVVIQCLLKEKVLLLSQNLGKMGDPISDGPDTKTNFYNKVGVFVRKKEAQSLLSSSSVICDRVFH